MDDPVVIVGGGIGGLTAALTLVQHELPCVVHEQTPELREIGAGLGLWPASLEVFDHLGLGDEVRALSRQWASAGLRWCDGRYLARYTAAEFSARLGEPAIGVHRGELQTLLLRSLPRGVLRTGSRCVGLRQSASGVVVESADRSTVRARAVIGADGQHSRVRGLLFGDRSLHDCRYVGWRGTATQPVGSDWHVFIGETWGPGGRFGILPIAGSRVTWYAATRSSESGGAKAELLRCFGGWDHPIPELVDATSEEDIWCDHIFDLWPLRRWSVGSVTLLGDAAHPMTPEFGQGACQAILDAWTLGRALASTADVGSALRTYERNRKPRAGFVTLMARVAAIGGNADSSVARALREQTVGRMPASILLRALHAIARAH